MNSDEMNTKNVIKAIQVLRNMYNTVRIVDPVENEILHLTSASDPALAHTDACYSLWEKSKSCDNCIAFRAVKERDTFIKFEVMDERIYMITACPVEYQDRYCAIEMLNDITDKGVLENIAGRNPKDFTSLVLRLNDALIRDDLTQIFNRRYINERLPVEMIRSITASTPATLVMADIDGFKKVNDSYGHIAGDMILQQLARVLIESVRNDQDWVARYGGEEFLFYLHNTDQDQALAVMDRVRQLIEKTDFTIPCETIHITCSLGICTLHKEMDINEWVGYADQRLYEAKARGGNMVVYW